MTHTAFTSVLTGMALLAGISLIDVADAGKWKKRNGIRIQNIIEATDLNSTSNPTSQPQDPVLSGGDRDQTLQFGDVLRGTRKDDLMIGKLGTDLLFGYHGDDIIIGGTEDFNPFNRDRAFGGRGNDIFLWAPGDGSDLFEGGKGNDAVMFGKIGEIGETGNIEFNVSPPGKPGSQDSDPIFLSPRTNLPLMDVSGSPGFCEIIDESNAVGGKAALDALNVDHLVKFFLKGERNDGNEDGDNGLRVTLHLKDVETVVCTNPDVKAIQVFDLTQIPAQEIDVDDIQNRKVRNRVKAMIL